MHKIFRKIKTFIIFFVFKIRYGKKLKVYSKISFRDDFKIRISKNAKIIIGKECFFNNYCSLNALNFIKIGDNCIFGENVKIYDHNHIFNTNDLISKSGYKTDEIIIGNNVWIGSNVVILKGVHIGNNCVIGAGSVISSNIDDDSLVYPNRNLVIEKIKRGEKSESHEKKEYSIN